VGAGGSGAYSGFGDPNPPFFGEIFFNLLGFFKIKNPKTPLNFFRPYKKNQKPSCL